MSSRLMWATSIGLAPFGQQDPAAGRLHQLDQHPPGGGLAAPRLPHQPEALTEGDVEADPVHGVDEIGGGAEQPPGDGELSLQVLHLEERWVHRGQRRGCCRGGHRRSASSSTGTSSQCQQATRCPGRTSSRGGSSTVHFSVANGHRGWNRQPVGGWSRSGGSPLERGELTPWPGDRWSGPEQQVGVRMDWPGEHVEGGPVLDQLPGVHDANRVGDLGDHRDVVGDVDDAHPQLRLDPLQLLEDLVLDDDVQRCSRLVGDDHLWAAGECHGDHGPLPHSAGELVRVAVEHLGREAHAPEELLHVMAHLGVCHLPAGNGCRAPP